MVADFLHPNYGGWSACYPSTDVGQVTDIGGSRTRKSPPREPAAARGSGWAQILSGNRHEQQEKRTKTRCNDWPVRNQLRP